MSDPKPPVQRVWSDRSILKGLKNPVMDRYVIKIKSSELTFLGAPNQPDFGKIAIEFTPNERIIELKSLKHYLFQFSSNVLSYERLINVIYEDLIAIYAPYNIRITIRFKPRGGIYSELVVDSALRKFEV